MPSDKFQELAAMREKLAKLETEVAAARQKELAALPAKFGFDTTAAFIAAVRAAGGKRRGRKAKAAAGRSKRKFRAVVTDETRAELKKLVEAGKTGGEIAKALKVSLPTVQNIKKAMGLVGKKGRGTKATVTG